MKNVADDFMNDVISMVVKSEEKALSEMLTRNGFGFIAQEKDLLKAQYFMNNYKLSLRKERDLLTCKWKVSLFGYDGREIDYYNFELNDYGFKITMKPIGG